MKKEKETDLTELRLRGLTLLEKIPFKVVIESPFLNADKINSFQQPLVKKIVDYLSKIKEVSKIIVFGSSITHDFDPEYSDLDFYVELDKEDAINYRDFYHCIKFPHSCDYFDNFKLNKESDFYKKEILEKGVVVYERS